MSISSDRETAYQTKLRVYQANEARALQMKRRGMSNVAIADEMGISESTVRRLLPEKTQGFIVEFVKAYISVRRDYSRRGQISLGAASKALNMAHFPKKEF